MGQAASREPAPSSIGEQPPPAPSLIEVARSRNYTLFRDALQAKGIQPCIPGRKSRNEQVEYDERRYRRSSRIEIMFGRLKDWRRVAPLRPLPYRLLAAIALAAAVIFWP